VDLTGDGQVTNADAMDVSLAWELLREQGRACGDLPTPELDINQDGCIDVSDAQMVVASYSINTAELAVPDTSSTPSAEAAVGLTFVVNSTGDLPDAVPRDGVCATAEGKCTLRAAISAANQHTGPDTIAFNIPGSGVHVIQLTATLPSILDESGGTTINGYTQPGSSPNTAARISNAVIRIEIVGAGPEAFPGLTITSAGNVVRGLSLYKLNRSIQVHGNGADNNVIAGNFIGTNAAGTYQASSIPTAFAHGINIKQGASGNRIGGTAPAARNVVSGNPRNGISMFWGGTNGNLVLGNLVGLNPSGTACLGNRIEGIDINYGAKNNIIGGTAQGERNVSTGNGLAGVDVAHGTNTTGNRVIGNYLGTGVDGKQPPANCTNNKLGVRLEDGVGTTFVSDNVIGHNREAGIRIIDTYTSLNTITHNWIGVTPDGTAIRNPIGVDVYGSVNTIGPDNQIAANTNQGVRVSGPAADSNTITRNAIWGNGKLGIDLDPAGATPNDAGDGDNGPNQQRNYPVLQTATTSQVSGTACNGCTVEVFVADSDVSGFGEGQRFIGSTIANADQTFAVAISGVIAGQMLTATATDANGNTSEFARNLAVGGGATKPKAPSALSAQRTGTGANQKITLTWIDNATNETQFVIQRSIGSTNNWTVLVTLPANTTTFVDTPLERQRTYYYRVRAKNDAGGSSFSNVVSAMTGQ
jgi:CSLREA domain-containing protein